MGIDLIKMTVLTPCIRTKRPEQKSEDLDQTPQNKTSDRVYTVCHTPNNFTHIIDGVMGFLKSSKI